MTVDLNLGATKLILDECRARGVLRNQAAYILATGFWETNRTMKPVEEGFWLKDGGRKHRSTLRYFPWYGRGFVQLTWEENYRKAGERMGIDLVGNKDLALMWDVAAQILVLGMIEGWFTGRKLSDYITLSRSDFVGARRIINGTDRAVEISAIAKEYDQALKLAGYGEEPAPVIDVPVITSPETPVETTPETVLEKYRRIGELTRQIQVILSEIETEIGKAA